MATLQGPAVARQILSKRTQYERVGTAKAPEMLLTLLTTSLTT